METYLQNTYQRQHVPTLAPYWNLTEGFRFIRDPVASGKCSWHNYILAKGVVNPVSKICVYGPSIEQNPGLHGTLIRGFEKTDPPPQCYDLNLAVWGFGNFFRFAYFSGPSQTRNYCGLDFCLAAPDHTGIANSLVRVHHISKALTQAGMPSTTKLCLLGPEMTEPKFAYNIRRKHKLYTVGDWVSLFEKKHYQKKYMSAMWQRETAKKIALLS